MTAAGANTMFNLVAHIGIASSWALRKPTMFPRKTPVKPWYLEILGPNIPFRKHMRVMLMAATTGKLPVDVWWDLPNDVYCPPATQPKNTTFTFICTLCVPSKKKSSHAMIQPGLGAICPPGRLLRHLSPQRHPRRVGEKTKRCPVMTAAAAADDDD